MFLLINSFALIKLFEILDKDKNYYTAYMYVKLINDKKYLIYSECNS